jgi:hypothetical protein
MMRLKESRNEQIRQCLDDIRWATETLSRSAQRLVELIKAPEEFDVEMAVKRAAWSNDHAVGLARRKLGAVKMLQAISNGDMAALMSVDQIKERRALEMTSETNKAIAAKILGEMASFAEGKEQ